MRTLWRQGRIAEALALLEPLLDHPDALQLKADYLFQMRRFDEAITLYSALLDDHPERSSAWTVYGHLLKTVGRSEEGIAALWRSVEIEPRNGPGWWALANLKTLRFGEPDVRAMKLALPEASEEDRIHIEFALGKALGDLERYEDSFAYYHQGNALQRARISYDAASVERHVSRSEQLFTRDFFAQRQGFGHDADDPIFIVGMPRSGSTLVEQILASHSRVEGTEELFDIPRMAQAVAGPARTESAYFEGLARLTAADSVRLGTLYVGSTRAFRRTSRPFFTDKLPNNHGHIGLIQLVLPRAKIIDVRRHPVPCCFSNYVQLFSMGQEFSYDLAELARYYRGYVRLMALFDRVMPGRVHRLFYEQLIENPEREARRLLDYLGLEFEPSCLRFFDNPRIVHTPSSEQVRRPINRDSLDGWRPYEPWLAPLKEALGPVALSYPELAEETA